MRIILAVALLTTRQGVAQTVVHSPEEKRLERLEVNAIRFIKTTIRLDREVYFPNEEAAIEIMIENTADSSIEVMDPFDRLTSAFGLYRIVRTPNGGEGFDSLLPHPLRPLYTARLMPPTIVLTSHHSETVRFSATDECEIGRIAFARSCLAPSEEGPYAWLFSSPGMASVRFSVYNPEIIEIAEIALRQPNPPGTLRSPGRATASPVMTSKVALVRGKDGMPSVLVATHPSRADQTHDMAPGTHMTPMGVTAMGRVRRILESNKRISGLRVDEDPQKDGELILTISDGTERKSLRFAPTYNTVEKQ